MRRREFIAGLGGIVAWPVVARAQHRRGQVAHIAYLGMTSPSALDPRQIQQFKQGLADNGLIEGRNITVDYVWDPFAERRALWNVAAFPLSPP
jgi:putative ABC transport system substrate-binding protein